MLTLDRANSPIYGGKALGLARLIAAGLPVQPGIVIEPRDRLDNINVTISYMLANYPDSLKHFLAARWAVRSSAVGEDGDKHSFAGQHDSILDVSLEALSDAINRVRGSVNTDRAKRYRRKNGLPDTAMVVIIQRMVPNISASAVVFTKHPIVDHNDDILIEWSPCRGDRLVSGMVTPEEVTVKRRAEGQVIVGPALDELASLALRCERAIGTAVDVEAAYNGRWWICQARPITETHK